MTVEQNPIKAGDKFGKWTVQIATRSSKPKKWLCICECGIKKEVRQDALKSGQSRSCGCQSVATHQRIMGAVLKGRA